MCTMGGHNIVAKFGGSCALRWPKPCGQVCEWGGVGMCTMRGRGHNLITKCEGCMCTMGGIT